MATSTWNTFANSTTASAVDVNANFDALEGDIVPMSAAGTFTNDTFNIGTSTAVWAEAHISNVQSDAVSVNVVSKTGNYTTTADDALVRVDATSGAITITLVSAAATLVTGQYQIIKKTDSSNNKVTIDASGSETIDGDTTKELIGQYGYIKLYSNGTNWDVVSYDSGWGDWIPTYGAGGSMTYTSVTSHVARYKMNLGVVTLELVSRGTTGGTASAYITLTLPKAPGNADVTNVHPSASCFTENISNGGIGYIRFSSGSTMDVFRNISHSNWSLGGDCGLNLLMTYEV